MATTKKQGNGYKITASNGYDINGKQIRDNMTWVPSPKMTALQIEKELNRQATLFDEKVRNGQSLKGSIRFADFAEKWMKEYAETQLRPRTIERYQSLLPRINAAIGHIHLDKLQPHHLIAFYKNLAESGVRADTKYKCKIDFKNLLKESKMTKKTFSESAGIGVTVLNSITQGRNISNSSAKKISKALNIPVSQLFEPINSDTSLSAKTIQHHHRLISSILTTAVQWQVIFSNPCDRVKPPKVEKTTPRYLDENEATLLIDFLQTEHIQNRTMVLVLLMTGFRRGELLGLEWSDIDFDRQMIHVRRSSLYLPGKGVFEDSTKNTSSERVIKVSSSVFATLKEFRAWQEKHRLSLGDQWRKSDRVFTSVTGEPLHPDTLSGWFHDFVKKNHLPDINIHGLRHTNATLQIAGGVPVSTVANRLGHANPSTTTKIYAHEIRSADEAAAETLQNILLPGENQAHKAG